MPIDSGYLFNEIDVYRDAELIYPRSILTRSGHYGFDVITADGVDISFPRSGGWSYSLLNESR